MALMDHKETQAILGPLEERALLEHRVILAIQGQREKLDQLESQVQQARQVINI
jgi:hypothetical protein